MTMLIYETIYFLYMQSEQQRVARVLKLVTDPDRKIYSIIKEYPCTKKDLNQRTKFPSNLLDKILKELSSYNLIKSIKRPQSKNMNVWVLSNHQEQEQPHQLIEEKDDLMEFIRRKEQVVTLNDLQKEATRKGIKTDNLNAILAVMEMRGEVILHADRVLPRQTTIINSPCMECNLQDVCFPEGKVSPTTCPYLLSW